jgi:protoporphyrinogen oxidase
LRELGLDSRWERHDPKTSPAARNRYLNTGARGLYRMPASLWELHRDIRTRGSLFRSLPARLLPIFWSLLSRAPYRGKPPPADVSVGEAVEFWVGRKWVDEVFSGFVRGITAGDAYKLSLRAFNEKMFMGHFAMLGARMDGLSADGSAEEELDQELFKAWRGVGGSGGTGHDPVFKEAGVMYLKNGLGAIPAALEAALRLSGSVEIRKNTKVTNLSLADDGHHVQVRFPLYHIGLF